ncbi:MAG TPA: ATP synthase F1 subunit delta [Clostridia bacterium]|nr:ATP synthase F1 subunit delta [Clostridia bacterium]
MKRQTVARRYAEAFFALSLEQGLLEQVTGDLELLRKTLEDNRELTLLVDNQRIPGDQKYRVLLELFEKRMENLTLNFLGVIFSKRREYYLKQIIAEFFQKADQHQGIMEVEIRTAVELGTETAQLLQLRLARSTGKKLRLKFQVQPELLGGALIKMGDKVIDGSVATKLKRLQQKLGSQGALS